MKKLDRIMEQYEAGSITHYEAANEVIRCVTPDNRKVVLDMIFSRPMDGADILQSILYRVIKCPKNDEEWSKMVSLNIGAYVYSDSSEEYEKRREEQRADYRRGLECLRDWYEGWKRE